MTASEKKQFLNQYEEIHESLMRFCIVKSQGIMDPKDLANDVLLIGLENYQKLKDKRALLSYLFTTANRICINKIRRKKFNGSYDERHVENIEDPNNNVESNVDISILYAALDQLPELQKEAVILFEISDLPIKEIMAIQNAGASAVKQRIKRGREKLAELMCEKKRKKIAVAFSVLFTTNSFSMSHLDTYFKAIKELPLPLTETEAASAISNFHFSGSAVNTAASKIGSTVIKKSIIGSIVVGTIIGATALISSQSETQHDNELNSTPQQTELSNNIQESRSETVNHTKHEITAQDEIEFSNNTTVPDRTLTATTTPDSIAPNEPITHPKPSDNSLTDFEREAVIFDMSGIKTVNIIDMGDNIEIKTWDRNEMKVVPSYQIDAKTPNDESILLENLFVNADKKGSKITFKSALNNDNIRKHGPIMKSFSTVVFDNKRKAKFRMLKMNYTILLPADVNLNLSGNYEQIIIPDMKGDIEANLTSSNIQMGSIGGEADLKLKYSKVALGDLKNTKLFVVNSEVTFGKMSNIDLTAKYSDLNGDELHDSNITLINSPLNVKNYVGDLNATIKYCTVKFSTSSISNSKINAIQSKLWIPTINELEVDMNYSTLNSDNITKLKIVNANQSTFTLEKVNSIQSQLSKYSTYRISELLDEIEINSNNDVLTLSKTNLARMIFTGKYSTYNITLAKPADYQLDYVGRYGNLNHKDLNLTVKSRTGSDEHRVIKGYFGNGNNSSPRINFDCVGGSVTLH
mgnify:CR=1 FL=1